MPALRIGLLLFPNVTQLDLTGPYEVLARIPGAEMHLVWKTLDAVRSDSGLRILPTTTFAEAPDFDLFLVPGGPGVDDLLTDAETLAFVRRQGRAVRHLVSVCTGALVLGAAGLLKGRRAATHWASMPFLPAFGAEPVAERVVVDGTLFTGGGVTAGIDVALTIVGELLGRAKGEAVQLFIEYAPQPPFSAGTPDTAPPAVLEAARTLLAPTLERRRVVVEAAARALDDAGTSTAPAPTPN
ncbi:MAG TPA: DJ-1/PfpI family protein [Azospirillum sp.]